MGSSSKADLLGNGKRLLKEQASLERQKLERQKRK
jgi:hypothetical protein